MHRLCMIAIICKPSSERMFWGLIRLNEARAHKEKADALRESLSQLHGEEYKQAKEESRQERRKYSQVKRARWALLKNSDNLRNTQAARLSEILDAHSDLAVCYAMKEEMCSLFDIRDPIAAENGWKKCSLQPRKARFRRLYGSPN